jgi:glucose/arabinose dehydrogenase
LLLTLVLACHAAPTVDLAPVFDGKDAGRPQLPVALRPIVSGVPQPTDIVAVPGRADRLVVLSKGGTAYLAVPGGAAEPWFTVEAATRSELGLLSIAFAPDFERTGAFVVHYNPAGPTRTVLRRGRVDPATLAGPILGEVLFETAQPYPNHDGGQLAFGPDGHLYVGLGDGGSAGDPEGNGQDLGSPLGKILRLRVPPTGPAEAPPDNPFVGVPGARPEIWAYGLRNPWRFTFDPAGRLIVADVGQDRWEEIDVVGRGDNLGWNRREADRCFPPDAACSADGLVDPIWVYGHDEGVSVTGGVVVGASGPLAGQYVFGDFGSGRLWAFAVPTPAARVAAVTALGRFGIHPSTFGRGPRGEALVADFGQGVVYELVPR